jgi:hypothetical protein
MTICGALKLIVMIVIGGARSISRRSKQSNARSTGGATLQPRAMMNATQKATKALSELSDAEWLQVKCDEERRRAPNVAAQQREIRDLSQKLRERRAPAR